MFSRLSFDCQFPVLCFSAAAVPPHNAVLEIACPGLFAAPELHRHWDGNVFAASQKNRKICRCFSHFIIL